MNIKWIGSPNFDKNRKPIDRIVLHWFGDSSTSSTVIAGVDAQFQKTGGTSAHYAVEKDVIHQYVKEEHVAYHAGVYTMNQRSIGIEHSGGPNRQITESTYKSSAALVKDIAERYKIPLDRNHIIAHRDVKSTACPGTLDIDKIIYMAKGEEKSDALTECLKQHTELVTKLDRLNESYDKLDESTKETIRGLKESIETVKAKCDAQIADEKRKCENKVNETILEYEKKIKQIHDEYANQVPDDDEPFVTPEKERHGLHGLIVELLDKVLGNGRD